MNQHEQVLAIYEKVTGQSDLDWSELAEQSGLQISSDHLRKMGYGIKLAAEAGTLQQSGVGDIHELRKIRDIRNELNTAYRADARSSALRDAVIEAAKTMPKIRTPIFCQKNEHAERCLVIGVGDFHYGAEWTIRGLNGEVINKYDPEVFESRMWTLFEVLQQIIRKEDIGEVKLMICGDSLDGMLRNSQLMKLRWGMVESCMRLAEFLTRWIEALAIEASIAVYTVDGNHGEIRPLGSRKGEFENENLEKVLAWYLEARYENIENVFIEPRCEKMKLVDVMGYRFLLTHGDNAKSLDQLAKQTQLLYGKPIDFFLCAHKHREQEAVTGYTEDGNAMVIRVPSVCGMNDYAQRLGYGGRPGALAMVIERGYGRRCVYPIEL